MPFPDIASTKGLVSSSPPPKRSATDAAAFPNGIIWAGFQVRFMQHRPKRSPLQFTSSVTANATRLSPIASRTESFDESIRRQCSIAARCAEQVARTASR